MIQCTATTPTPHVTVVCSSALSLTITYHGAYLDRATSYIRSAWCGSATTTDSKGHKSCCWPHYCAAAAAISIPDAFAGICQLCHGYSIGNFFFSSWVSYAFLMPYVGVCCDVCLLLSGSPIAAMFTNGVNHWGLQLQPLGVYHWKAYMPPSFGSWPI